MRIEKAANYAANCVAGKETPQNKRVEYGQLQISGF
jgi:hypothetical protein